MASRRTLSNYYKVSAICEIVAAGAADDDWKRGYGANT